MSEVGGSGRGGAVQSVDRAQDLAVVSRTACIALAEALGETVNLVVQQGGSVITIDQVIGSATMTTVNWVGRRSPLHVTSAGNIFLATMPSAELSEYLDAGLTRFTDRTIVDRAALEAELDRVRAGG